MFLKLALLLFITSTSALDEEVFIRCNFFGTANYVCNLLINNPNGIEFDQIEGNHIGNNTDSDVRVVQGVYQNTRNIPQIICQQFTNLNEIFIEYSNLEVLTAESLSACANIEYLFLGVNAITSIPERVFANNPNLNTVGLFRNLISEIHENAFVGSSIQMLELDNNQLKEINPRWFVPIESSLVVLTLSSNELKYLPKEGFGNLSSLWYFDLSHNPLGHLNFGAFNSMNSLETLRLANVSLYNVHTGLFEGLTSLRQLTLSRNHLRILPHNLFDGLDNLRVIEINNNRLTELNSNTFGSSLTSIYEIDAADNQITSVDSVLIDQTTNLYYLFLGANSCTNRNFYGVVSDRESVRRELETCVTNFGYIDCIYFDLGGGIYNCMMLIHNPTGRNTFDRISGNHIPGMNDSNVLFVSSMMMHTANIPSIICQQFPSLQSLSVTYSKVEMIDGESFMNCYNIERISLGNNLITEIPSYAFGKLGNLQSVTLNNNNITTIGENPFFDTSLNEINLDYNLLTEFNAEAFNEAGSTLRRLYLTKNHLSELPERAFSGLRNLEMLSLNRNQLQIPKNAFEGLSNLIYLNLGENGMEEMHGEWFSDLTSLTSLRIYDNNFNSIPHNAFNNLTSLIDIDMSRNNLNIISEKSFGASLNTLTYVFSDSNRINFIDPDFFTKGVALDYLFVSDNLCVDTNFFYVRFNLEYVRNATRGCMRNYDGFISCSYFAPGIHYTCNLETMNLYGRENFFSIEGDHRENQTDSDVISITGVHQHTKNIPLILCLTFINTIEIIIENSQIETIDMQTFASCNKIEFISLSYNLIDEIPNGTFAFKPNLKRIGLYYNKIERIANLAFTDTIIEDIYLDYNELTTYNVVAFNEVSSTLKFLTIANNKITSIPNAAFSQLGVIEILNLSNNPIGNIPENAFHGMVNLGVLIIHDCEISELHVDQFRGLNSLKDLRLSHNSLTSLPHGVFNELWNLTEIDLDHNNLFVLPAEAFGTTVSTIQYLFAWSNEIFAIDAEFFDNANELRWLFMRGNICSNQDFFDILYNRAGVRNSIGECLTFYNQLPESIGCTYIDSGSSYYCLMRVFNPGGRIAFNSIEGNHTQDRGDDDVVDVNISNQNTRIVPNIVCRQFYNLNMLIITTSRLAFLNSNSFEGCKNLEVLLMNFNHIVEIPDSTFSTTPNLYVMQLVSNRVERIGPLAFAGSNLVFLDLSDNFLRQFNPAPFEAVNSTLSDLMLPINRLTGLPENAFDNLRNLVMLQLNYNELNNNIPQFAFSQSTRLETLTLIDCGLTIYDRNWFSGLGALRTLQLPYNRLTELPANAFSGMWNLQLVNLASNNLSILNSTSFTYVTNYIHSIYAYNNQLQAIDPLLLNDYVRLNSFLLEENLCVNQNFANVSENLPTVREELSTCFTNFRPPLRCDFTDGDLYECNLRLNNPAAVNDFSPITGDHFYEYTDENVGFVQIYRQTSPNFPSIVCEQFPNIEEIFIDSSGFSRLNSDSFSGCSNLWLIFISYNQIGELLPRIFEQNSNLLFIYLRSNQIERISDETFVGIPLEGLFLDGNRLTIIHGSWFTPVSLTLEMLDLSWNQIQTLGENSFGDLANLKDLKIDGNNLSSVAVGVFGGLQSLEILSIRDSGLREFNPQWFTNSSRLRNIYLDGNSIASLPDGAFSGFEQLFYVNLNRNQLTTLNSLSFGGSLRSIATLNAMSNQINAIDPQIFESIENLQNLFLIANVCVQRNFLNVMNDLVNVRNELQGCFDNFSGN